MSLLGQPAPDFSDPLGMLAACHGRMLGFCDLLERLPAWIEANGIDDEACAASRRVIRYFSTAGQLHHQDEEEDLFPLLVDDAGLSGLIERLRDEHRTLDSAWQTLAPQLDDLLDRRCKLPVLSAAIDTFCNGYRAHLRIENQQLLPKARTLLDAGQLAALGKCMAARRSENGSTPG